MRKFLGWTTALSFLFLLETVGAIEQNMISLKTGAIRSIIGLIILWVSLEKANGFFSRKIRKAALGVADRKAASTKAQSDYIRR